MKFIIKQVTSQGARLGELSKLSHAIEEVYQTPMVLLVTHSGSVPHITQETLQMLQQSHAAEEKLLQCSAPDGLLLSVPVQHFAKQTNVLQQYSKGVAAFAGMRDRGVLGSVQCPLSQTPDGYNTRKTVSTWSTEGRIKLRPQQHMATLASLHCCCCEALHDADTPRGCSNSRIRKSFVSSLEHLRSCLVLAKELPSTGSILAPLLGGWEVAERKRWVALLAELQRSHKAGAESMEGNNTKENDASSDMKAQYGGYTLKGLHSNGASAERLEPESLMLDCVRAALSGVDQTLPRVALGGYNPHTTLALVVEGLDVLDTALPCLLSERRAALTFSHNSLHATDSSHKSTTRSEQHDSIDPLPTSKKQKTAHLQDQTVDEKPYEINLNNKTYCNSAELLMEGCMCYTCSRGYTRGYLHHLCSSNEMLAPVLLNLHNLHHWLGFMSSIRRAVAANTLDKLQLTVLDSYRCTREQR